LLDAGLFGVIVVNNSLLSLFSTYAYAGKVMEAEEVGKALKHLRANRKMSLRELGRIANISPASLVAIEKGHSSPNLATLHKILKSMNASFADFFADSGEGDRSPVFARGQMAGAADKHREYRFLFPRRGDIKFQMVHETIAPSETDSDWEVHDFDLGGVILSGRARLEISGRGEWNLKKGSAFYVYAGSRHRLINIGPSQIKQVTVAYPPRY
jgi:transcriptional regulator with XRE-family HTH domain